MKRNAFDARHELEKSASGIDHALDEIWLSESLFEYEPGAAERTEKAIELLDGLKAKVEALKNEIRTVADNISSL